MKKLIKADLAAILRLAGECQPIEAGRLDMSIARLCRQEFPDYLFLARQNWCWLFDFPAVYEKGSYANLCWLAYRGLPGGPVLALFLHIEKSVEGLPWGSATLLDYPAAAQDAAIFCELPPAQRERHCRLIVKRCTKNVRYCSMREVIRYLKTGEVK